MLVPIRPYQERGVESVSNAWKSGARGVILCIPTGGGKTRVAIHMCARAIARGRRVLFLAHRRRLVQQIAETAKEFGIPYGVVMASLPKDEQSSSWARNNPSAPLQVASRDTLISRVMNRQFDGLPPADLLIIDETRHVQTEKYLALAQTVRAPFWLGLDATPVRPDGKGLGKSIYQEIVAPVTVQQLIDEKYLVPVKCYSPPELAKKRKEGGKTSVAGDPIEHWRRYAQGLSTVVFCPGVAASLAIRDRYRAVGVSAEHIDYETPQDERDRIFEGALSGKITVVTNSSLLTEGVDVPRWACCQILKKFGNIANYLQAVGRIMRKHDESGKTHGVLLDHSGCVAAHILPHETVEWSLAEDDDVDCRVRKAKENGELSKPVVCKRCGAIFAGLPKCPECGAVVLKSRKKSEPSNDHELLREVNDSGTVSASQMGARWKSLLWQGIRLNWKAGFVGYLFHKEFGVWPNKAGVKPIFPFDDRDKKVAELLPNWARGKS